MEDRVILKTTTQQELHSKAKESLWELNAVYALDSQNIDTWLMEHARKNLTGAIADPLKKQSEIDRAISQYETLSSKLEELYHLGEMGTADKEMQAAKEDLYKRNAPTPASICFWWVALILAGGLEIAFFSYLVLFGEAGGALIGLAILLLVGGLLTGNAAATMMMHSKKTKYTHKEEIEKKQYIPLVVGIILILAVSAIRFSYGGLLAGVIALLFGLAVTVSEIFLKYNKLLREWYLNLMFKAQQYYSAIQIRRCLKDPNTYIDDEYFKHYKSHISEISRTISDVIDIKN